MKRADKLENKTRKVLRLEWIAKKTAQAQGYTKRIPPQKALFNSHGEPVFWNGRTYITPDIDRHKGGMWKMFDHQGNRIGTYDEYLNRIGD